MKAVVFAGAGEIRVDEVPEPRLQGPGDAIIEVRRTAICGSDLHLLDGKTQGMRTGGIIGHEFVGTITHTGDKVSRFSPGDRVIGSFLIACGVCPHCVAARFNFCSNRRALGLGTLTGDLDGAQAELVRVPTADLNLRTLGDLDDEGALFAGDVLATGFYAASLGEIGPDDRVAVVGAGPVGLAVTMAVAGRGGATIVLDTDERRVAAARQIVPQAEVVHTAEERPEDAVRRTLGDLADVSFDAVGAPPVFRACTKVVRDGGRVVVVGVYGTERYELPMGMVWVRGLDLRFAGMANVQAHWDEVVSATEAGTIDPRRLITHRLPLEEAESGYELFRSREALKVVLEV